MKGAEFQGQVDPDRSQLTQKLLAEVMKGYRVGLAYGSHVAAQRNKPVHGKQ